MSPTELKKLQQIWRRKLERSGFEDAETPDGQLKNYALHWTSVDSGRFHATQRYYELAGQMLHTHPFKDVVDKTVWRHHSQGKTWKEIADKMGLTLRQVRSIIDGYAKYITTNE